MSEPTSHPKLLESLRSLAGSMGAMIQTRLELASVELAEERSRLMKMAMLALFGLVFFGLAMVTLTVLIAIVFWDSYRWQAIGFLIGIYLLACVACLMYARHLGRSAPPLFEATLAELDKDREILRR